MKFMKKRKINEAKELDALLKAYNTGIFSHSFEIDFDEDSGTYKYKNYSSEEKERLYMLKNDAYLEVKKQITPGISILKIKITSSGRLFLQKGGYTWEKRKTNFMRYFFWLPLVAFLISIVFNIIQLFN